MALRRREVEQDVQLWDDAAFVQRVKEAAERKGMTIRQVLEAAVLAPSFLEKKRYERGTDAVLQLARVLDVPAAEMFGIATYPPDGDH